MCTCDVLTGVHPSASIIGPVWATGDVKALCKNIVSKTKHGYTNIEFNDIFTLTC